MASGKFASNVYSGAGSEYSRYVEVIWSSANNTANNTSTITWTAYVRSSSSNTRNYLYAKNIVVTINGVSTTLVGSTSKKTYKDSYLGGGTVAVNHDGNGKKAVSVSIAAEFYVYGKSNSSYNGTIIMSPNPVYTLEISAGTGSTITVNRTSSAGSGGTDNLSAGSKKLYYGDTLKITFAANTGYEVTEHKVNGNTFTSGGTYTVGGNVTVKSVARLLASSVGATDANIGSNSTITVTKYSSSYYHSLYYEFEGLSGWINADGTISNTEVKYTNTSVSFAIPASFYNQIPNSSTGKCTIICRTYTGADSTTVLGSPTQCKITVTATGAPVVSGVVIDINENTTALTGDNTVLVRYMSTAQATITATAQNGASIKEKRINGVLLEDSSTVEIEKVEATSFVFTAVDSRGYSTSVTVVPKGIVPYIPLTINPVVSRSSPTSNSIQLTFNGNWFNGYFDEDKGEEGKSKKNSITITYRFRTNPTPEGQAYDWSEWQEIDADKIIKQTGSYNSDGAITLTGFDYQKSYVVTVKVTDGTLTTAAKTVQLAKGVPVFDWGEDDFNFNVDVKINNTNIYDIIYPINSVYISVVNTLPEVLSAIGTWESITTGIAGTFAWKRIENANSQ